MADRLPPDASVRIMFQAVGDDGLGWPDENDVLVDWTADVSHFAALAPGTLRWMRYQVEVDRGVAGAEVALEFLRIPFRF